MGTTFQHGPNLPCRFCFLKIGVFFDPSLEAYWAQLGPPSIIQGIQSPSLRCFNAKSFK